MPTFVTITVKPSGGDYTSLNTALAAVSSNLITSDEQVTIECSTFAGGLLEAVTIPTITQDATRFLLITAAAGHEYNPVDDSGFYISASVGFSAPLVNGQDFTQFKSIGIKNTRTLGSGRGFDNFGNDNVIDGCYATTTSTSGAICFFLNNANNLTINNCLSYAGTTGFDFGNNNIRTASNLTSIDASSVGIDTGTAVTTLIDSLSLGSTDPYLGTFSGSSTNNAGDSTDTPGAFPQNNRTTADLVNYAFGDYRTASASALATAGTGGSFIGYALEASAGTTAAITESGPSFTESINVSYSANISGAITETGPSFTESINATLTKLSISASITENGPSFTEAISATITPALSIVASITESGPSFTESISATQASNILAGITEIGPSFVESINLTLNTTVEAAITESGPSFTEMITAEIPIKIAFNPKNVITVKRSNNTVKIKRKTNIKRVN